MRLLLLVANFIIVLLLISAVQSKSRDDSAFSNDDSVDAKIAKLEQINTTIHEVITTAGHNPQQEILTKYFPADAQLINDHPDWVERCYSSSVNGKTMNIFEKSIGSVVHQYLHKSLLKHDNVTHDSIYDRVTALLDNMHQLGLLIIECVKGQSTGQKPTKIGLTKFAEMSAEDIRSIYKQPLEKEDNDDEIEKHILGSNSGGAILGRQRGKKISGFLVENSRFEVNSFSKNYPEAFDYRDQFVVGPVKDQGTCGLCFLFGIMAAIESSYMLKHGKQNVSFSEKDLVDCMVQHHYYPGTAKMVVNKKVQMDPITGKPIMVPSCRPGGQQKKVLLEAKHTGLTLLSQGDAFVRDIALGQGFPFKPENCGHDPIVTKVTGWATQNDIPEDEDFLKAVLTKYGPVSTVFRTDLMVNGKTNDMVFFMIKEKMHYECDASTSANHVMTIIGWEKDYWIIRNSYGNYKDDGRTDQPAIDQAWGVEGVLYLDKKVAKSCGIFGPGSVWYFPEVE